MLCIPRIRLDPDLKESGITPEMLFDTPDHETQYNNDQIRTEMVLLSRLLVCSLKFISFKNERQLLLRRLLRYLKEILPHKSCTPVFKDCLSAAKEFAQRLKSKKDSNLKTMRIAYSFLKNANVRCKRRNDRKHASRIRELQEEIYHCWGPLLLVAEDNTSIDPNTASQMMNLALDLAEDQLENDQHHTHSLWVFLQHQKWWEYKFQDKNMKKFKQEYILREVCAWYTYNMLFFYFVNIYKIERSKKT